MKATWTSSEDPKKKTGSLGALVHCGAAVGLATLRIPRSVLVLCELRRLSFTVEAGILQLLSSRHLPDSGRNTCMRCGQTHVDTYGPALRVSGRLHLVLSKRLELTGGATNYNRSHKWSPQPGSHPVVGTSGEFALLSMYHRAAVMSQAVPFQCPLCSVATRHLLDGPPSFHALYCVCHMIWKKPPIHPPSPTLKDP